MDLDSDSVIFLDSQKKKRTATSKKLIHYNINESRKWFVHRPEKTLQKGGNFLQPTSALLQGVRFNLGFFNTRLKSTMFVQIWSNMAYLKPKTQEFMNLYEKIEKNILNSQICDFLERAVFQLSTSILSSVSKEKQ